MARIAGIDLPKNKRGEIGLTYIYGIGRSTSRKILSTLQINFDKKVEEWNDDDLTKIRKFITDNFKVEDIGSYRGVRHRSGLPVRGQKTKNNSRTRKGRKKTIANKKMVTK
jgi:small subunit ribosomal protein S13